MLLLAKSKKYVLVVSELFANTQTFSGQPRNKRELMTVFLHQQDWGEHLISLDYLETYSKKESITFLWNVIDWGNDLIIQSVFWGWLLWSAFYFPGSLRSDTCYAKSWNKIIDFPIPAKYVTDWFCNLNFIKWFDKKCLSEIVSFYSFQALLMV